MIETIKSINNTAEQEIIKDSTINDLELTRVKFLGKKGELTLILREMKNLSIDERKKVGKLANDVRQNLTELIDKRKSELETIEMNKQLAEEEIDISLQAFPVQQGSEHLLTQVINQIEEFFISMSYQVVSGPEVEEDHYNFEMMNMPKDHPARDMQDTFYLGDNLLMRTHTSPVEARMLEKHDFTKGPLKMISPGRVFRRDTDDATHSHQFNQIEGLVVDEHITMADLKGTLLALCKDFFGADREIRLRPSYFPFTEPSVEVDVSCFNCNGGGCEVCKYTGWIEVLGAGLTHPNVLRAAGVDDHKYNGFAFGLGPDRFAMLKYGIKDIRNFYQNDVRFLNQFK